ncbi:hypothetical protein CK203_036969 [Vitis vinifera]|uniref:Uncharacterized protein n=1 Tax=Vitis vinifera TaxID=29760 RepID=A0A438IUV5_VITVI|nr:hypothetical protein CK203_036969 [Vitis vinifera]
MLRTETDVKYIGDLAVIVPLDVPCPVAMTYECRADENEEECESQEGDDQTLHEAMESEQGRYVSVDGECCDMSNNPDPDDPIEYSPVQYHSAPSLQFENVENIDLQHAAKLYSLSQHQEYVVVSSTTKLLVLRCKKAEQSQCPWKLRAMVVKGTTSFAINKYNGPHKCVNPCLNRDHQQLDSNLIAAHIQGMIKAQFTLSVAAIQASIVEKFGYQISYKKASKAKLKALTNLFGDFYKSYAELPHFFIALEQANPGCVVISKTFPGIMENTEIFQRVFWTFQPSIEGFKHCRPVLSIDGTHLYGKYKGTLMIAMGCDGNNQTRVTNRRKLCVISDRHPGIMAAMSDVHLGWSEPYAYHRVCMRHLASNFMTRFKDKILKNLMCRAALATKIEKFNKHMNTIGRINAAAQQWLEAIPFEKWALSHDGGRRYDIMTTNMSEVFNSVLKGARSLPVTALVQLTFFRLNSYFVVRREQGANRLASSEEYTPYVDAKMKANVVKGIS